MRPDQYRAAIAALGLSQRAAARVIKIDERTSRKYAAKGVPASSVGLVTKALEKYRQPQQPDQKEEK